MSTHIDTMRGIKSIVVAVCLVLTAITVKAQEKRYELDEAKVAPGFYLAPNGYEYQLPQYGLTITIPPQSYYKVPYLLKHNAYLVTSDKVVSYCLYKFYLSNSYTDFALFGSFNGNMKYKVAELKNNDKQDFLEKIKKKKDYKVHRSLRTPFATFSHYSAENEVTEGRLHGFYYLVDNILIEFIVIPRDQNELTKCEEVIKTLRKADLKKELDDYLTMLATLQSTVPEELTGIETKEEEEIEVLYEQELATPTIPTQPASPFAEPTPGTRVVNPEAQKNTSELAAMLRASYGSKQEEPEEEVEVVAVKIAEPTQLVVFKDGFVNPPEVDLDVNVKTVELPKSTNAQNRQKTERAVEESLLAIVPVEKRPNVDFDVNVSNPTVTIVDNTSMYTTTTSGNSSLVITPVEKRPEVAIDVDVAKSALQVASSGTINTSTGTAEESLLNITPVVKQPEIEVTRIETPAIVPGNTNSGFTTSTNAEKSLLAIAAVEKRPQVSVDIEVAQTDMSVSNSSINAANTNAEKTLAVAPIEKVSTSNSNVDQQKVVASDTGSSEPVYVVTKEIAEDYWSKVHDVSNSVGQKTKFVNLLESSTIEEKETKKVRTQPGIVDNVELHETVAVTTQKEVINTFKPTTKEQEVSKTVSEPKVVQAQVNTKNEREKCTREEVKVLDGHYDQAIPYSRVQQKPTFNGGGYNDFALWVGDNMCYPEDLKQDLEGYVTVEIVIDVDGSIGRANVMSSPHKLLEKEVIYMLGTSPKWTPGIQDGVPVAVSVVIGVPVSAYI